MAGSHPWIAKTDKGFTSRLRGYANRTSPARRDGIRTVAAVALLVVGGCHFAPKHQSVATNQNCLPPMVVAKLEKRPISAGTAKRLAQHYGACLYDADGAEKWLREAVADGDPIAMKELAELVVNRRGPAANAEARELRERAALIEKDAN